jgi:hypothetical protein
LASGLSLKGLFLKPKNASTMAVPPRLFLLYEQIDEVDAGGSSSVALDALAEGNLAPADRPGTGSGAGPLPRRLGAPDLPSHRAPQPEQKTASDSHLREAQLLRHSDLEQLPLLLSFNTDSSHYLTLLLALRNAAAQGALAPDARTLGCRNDAVAKNSGATEPGGCILW